MKKIILFVITVFTLFVSTVYAEGDYSDTVYTAYGDSITDIVQNENITKYPELMKIKFGLGTVNNFGIGSSCLAVRDEQKVQSGIENIIEHSSENKKSHIVTMCYGTNDWYYGVKLGTIDDTDTSTYWGAFNSAVTQLRADNPSVEIIVLSPIWRTDVENGSGKAPYFKNKTGVTLAEYVDEIKKMCSANSVRFIDLYSNMGVREQTVSLYTTDGLHPNQQGHIRIANMLSDTFKEMLDINTFAELIYNDGYDSSDISAPDPTSQVTDIADFVDTERGAVTGIDELNNMPVKEEATGPIVSKSDAYNFYIQTTSESSNIFNLYTDGTWAYGVFLSNNITYGGHLTRTNIDTGVTENSNSYLKYIEHYTLPSAGKNIWHFVYSKQNDAWYIYTVDADANETFTAKITKENLQSAEWTDLSQTTPLFVYTGYGQKCFTLINNNTPSAKISLVNNVLTTELNNVENIDLAYGVYNNNNVLTDVALPEITNNKASAEMELQNAKNIKIYFWTALERLEPVMKNETIPINADKGAAQ